jgi:hypothetical protein
MRKRLLADFRRAEKRVLAVLCLFRPCLPPGSSDAIIFALFLGLVWPHFPEKLVQLNRLWTGETTCLEVEARA